MITYKKLTIAEAVALADRPHDVKLAFRDDREGLHWTRAQLRGVHFTSEFPFLTSLGLAFNWCAQIIETPDVYEPWTLETAPKGCVLIRNPLATTPEGAKSVFLVTEWRMFKIVYGACNSVSYEALAVGYEHSLDGKTWSPCGTLKKD